MSLHKLDRSIYVNIWSSKPDGNMVLNQTQSDECPVLQKSKVVPKISSRFRTLVSVGHSERVRDPVSFFSSPIPDFSTSHSRMHFDITDNDVLKLEEAAQRAKEMSLARAVSLMHSERAIHRDILFDMKQSLMLLRKVELCRHLFKSAISRTDLVTATQIGLEAIRGGPLREGWRALVIGCGGGFGMTGAQLARKLVGESGTVVVLCSTPVKYIMLELYPIGTESFKVLDYLRDDIPHILRSYGAFDVLYNSLCSWEPQFLLDGIDFTVAIKPFLKFDTPTVFLSEKSTSTRSRQHRKCFIGK